MNKTLWYLGIGLFTWFTYSIGANIREYVEMGNYTLLFITFVPNLAMWLWLAHCLFIDDNEKNFSQLGTSSVLILLYIHFFILNLAGATPSATAAESTLKTISYALVLIFLVGTYPLKTFKRFLHRYKLLR